MLFWTYLVLSGASNLNDSKAVIYAKVQKMFYDKVIEFTTIEKAERLCTMLE